MNNTNYPDILYNNLSEFNKEEYKEIESNKLFDYQKNVFNFMTKTNQRGILLYHSVGSGKCMAFNTPVLMFNGSIKKIQDIVSGELIMGDDSSSRQILSLARGVDDMYNVWYGSSKYTVNKEHILCLKSNIYPLVINNKDKLSVRYLLNGVIQNTDFYYDTYKNKDIAKRECLQFVKMLKTNSAHNIVHIRTIDYLSLDKEEKKKYVGFRNKIFFSEKKIQSSPLLIGSLSTKNCSLLTNEYVVNSIDVRQYIIAGIISSLGRIVKYKGFDAYDIAFTKIHSKNYINKIMFILNSLTVGCILKKNKDIKGYKLSIYGKELIDIHSKSSHSDYDFKPDLYTDTSLYKINVKYAGINNYYGFCISGNRRYVLGDCTITHNTMTSVSIAEFFKRTNKDVIVLSSKSLQINYKKEIINFRKLNETYENSDEDLKKYKFITSNAKNMIDKITNIDSKLENKEGVKNRLEEVLSQINKQSLDNKVLIVDEAHNLFNSISNGSEIANRFYDMVMNAKNIKIIFMTGTPIINDPYEIAICFNMIMGNMKSNKHISKNTKKNDYMTLFPEYYTDFYKYFIASGGGSVANEMKFKNRIFGLTSYYGDFYSSGSVSSISQDLKQTSIKENYPDRLPVKFEVVPMSNIQSTYYLKARDTEKLETANSYIRGSGINSSNEGQSSSTSYRIKSRQVSNIVIDNKTFAIASEKKDISDYSTKIAKIVENIEHNKESIGNVLIYSTFLEYGVEAVAKFLDILGYSLFSKNKQNDDSAQYKYAIFSGKQTEEEKTDILNIFNSQENIEGKHIKILMITKSGTEGLDLKNVRFIHIMEPYWNFSLIQQVIARGVRYKSHISLDEKYRNVQVYMYLSDYNKEDLNDIKSKQIALNKSTNSKKQENIEKTTDIHMLTNAIKNQELIYKFLKAIASTSIECKFFNEKELNYSCFSCKNTNERLYVEDFYTDMKTKNNCIPQKKVKAREIIIEDKVYYYSGNDDLSLKIFKKLDIEYGNNIVYFSKDEFNYDDIKNTILKHLENKDIHAL